MGQSGNPAKKAATKKTAAKKTAPKVAAPSSLADFKKRSKGELLPLPSGLAVVAKRVELQSFILQGNVPNALMGVVSEALEKGQKADIPAMMGVEEGKVDLDAVNDMYEVVNAIVVASVVNPKVHSVPEDEADRDDDLLYVDELDELDKMFLFQWNTGGVSDLETFRREARADMDALAEIQGGGS